MKMRFFSLNVNKLFGTYSVQAEQKVGWNGLIKRTYCQKIKFNLTKKGS